MDNFQASLVTSAMLTLVFLYLYVREGDRYLAIWTAAFAMWAARYTYGAAAIQITYIDAAVVLPLLALGRATFILWGSLVLHGKRLPRWWWVLIGADVAWLIAVTVVGVVPPFPQGLTHYTIFGLATIAAGIVFARAPGVRSGERMIAGFFLASLGALNLLFPFLRHFSEATIEALFGLTAITQLGIGLSVLLVYMEAARGERDRLHRELEAQLTKVISGYIPICAHCKSVREKTGSWSQIDHFVAEKSGASLSHSICPSCYDENYGAEFGPIDAP